MFTSFLMSTWYAVTMVAIVSGLVGYFVVLRRATFAAHAIPQGAFAGAAGAVLIGVAPIAGLGVFSVAGAFGIAFLTKRGRRDAVTALVLVSMLALGGCLLSWSGQFATQAYSLLFGEVLGISRVDLISIGALTVTTIVAIGAFARPLLLTSVLEEVASSRGVRTTRYELVLLVIVAMATTVAVPVVGALLMFVLMVAPAGAAVAIARAPSTGVVLSIGVALLVAWGAVVCSYATNWPIGFFVGVGGGGVYLLARLLGHYRSHRGAWRRSRRV